MPRRARNWEPKGNAVDRAGISQHKFLLCYFCYYYKLLLFLFSCFFSLLVLFSSRSVALS